MLSEKINTDFNVSTLQFFGAEGVVLLELLDYCNHTFCTNSKLPEDFPLRELPHIQAYKQYVEESEVRGVFETLKSHLVQLQFPVKDGISNTDDYKNATLRGNSKKGEYQLTLADPDNLKLEIYKDSLIGQVPVLTVPDNRDFRSIVCALSNKNEPKELPASMGAVFISGLNNWSRIHTIRRKWLEKHPPESWNLEFRSHILPCKELYQDQLMILSTRPYSNVPAQALGIKEEDWKTVSVSIRRAHECAHLFTLRQYGKMATHIFDELIADYVGIMSVLGHFELVWFLHFMGLENVGSYREGGRFQNYIRGLSSESTKVLQKLLISAARNLQVFDLALGASSDPVNLRNRIQSICELDLILLASNRGQTMLLEKYRAFEQSLD